MILNMICNLIIMRLKYLAFALLMCFCACTNKPENAADGTRTYKGMYSFGPEEKSFKDCSEARMFWVVDSSAQLELQYSQLHFEKPYEPVYIQVIGKKVLSKKGDVSDTFDSTLVVKKLISITKEIPADCN